MPYYILWDGRGCVFFWQVAEPLENLAYLASMILILNGGCMSSFYLILVDVFNRISRQTKLFSNDWVMLKFSKIKITFL